MNELINTIYNRYGEPVLQVLNDGRFIGRDGKNFGYFSGINLYNYYGEHVGWFENEVIRDHNGSCVGFGENPTDDSIPFLPFKQTDLMFFAVPLDEPLQQQRQVSFPRPYKQSFWSEVDPRSLFIKNYE